MTAPADREFEVLRRGFIRDTLVLGTFRNGLRELTDPETGLPFTEETIQRATQPGSRWYIEADAIDQMGQLEQRRAIFLSDQARIERANTSYLEGFHARHWAPDGKLDATGGSGTVSVPAVADTIIVGSTTLPDPAAYKARDAAGNIYQVFSTVQTPLGGVATVTMAAIDTGAATNLKAGTKLTWTFRDPNMEPEATVADDFSGGTDEETDAEFASRMMGEIRHKPAAGNAAHFRSWVRGASNAIEDGFVYPCAMHGGSVVVAITQKRANVTGPLARIPSSSTLADVIARLTPPYSPVVPARVFVVAVPVQAKPTNAVVQLDLQRGTAAGWADVTPFPSYHATTPIVTAVTSQTDFTITCLGDATLPGQASGATLSGDDAPQLMVWAPDYSEFIPLGVSSVQDLGGNQYRVLLSATPTSFSGPFTLAIGHFVSPAVARHTLVSNAVEEYFDSLGPGDLFDTSTDPRGNRCVRFPRTNEEYPYRAGAVLATRIIEALGGSSADGTLASMSYTTPGYPTNITDGPYMLTIASVGVYAL